jgi:hypothetical protein
VSWPEPPPSVSLPPRPPMSSPSPPPACSARSPLQEVGALHPAQEIVFRAALQDVVARGASSWLLPLADRCLCWCSRFSLLIRGAHALRRAARSGAAAAAVASGAELKFGSRMNLLASTRIRCREEPHGGLAQLWRPH